MAARRVEASVLASARVLHKRRRSSGARVANRPSTIGFTSSSASRTGCFGHTGMLSMAPYKLFPNNVPSGRSAAG